MCILLCHWKFSPQIVFIFIYQSTFSTPDESNEGTRLRLTLPHYSTTELSNENGEQGGIDENQRYKQYRTGCCNIAAAAALILLSLITTGTLLARIVIPDCTRNSTAPDCPAHCFQDSFDRLSNIMFMVWSLLHSLIYALFFYRLFHNKDGVNEIKKQMKSGWWIIILFTAIFGVVYLPLSVATPVIGAIADAIHSTECAAENQNQHFGIIIVNAITTGSIHMIGFPIRLSMIIATRAVRSIWDSEPVPAEPELELETEPALAEDKFARQLVNSYVERGEKVKPILKIFEAWFVLQWIVYFLTIFVGITNIVMAYLHNIQHEYAYMEYVFSGLYVAISLVAFSIPYACGNMTNSYHKKYIDRMRESCVTRDDKGQFKEVKWETTWSKISYIKKEDYDFVPKVWGLSIPLNNSGYTITIFISIFGLICTFLASPPNMKFK